METITTAQLIGIALITVAVLLQMYMVLSITREYNKLDDQRADIVRQRQQMRIQKPLIPTPPEATKLLNNISNKSTLFMNKISQNKLCLTMRPTVINKQNANLAKILRIKPRGK